MDSLADQAGDAGAARGAPHGHAAGQRTPLIDGIEKVTGRARYTADLPFPDALVGRILRSPVAHGTIRGIDTRRAEKLPGVLAVVTARDLAPAGEGAEAFARDAILAGDKALYQGHPIAAVAATSAAVAERALGLIRVDYEVLEPVLDVVAATEADSPLLHDRLVIGAGGDGREARIVAHHERRGLKIDVGEILAFPVGEALGRRRRRGRWRLWRGGVDNRQRRGVAGCARDGV